MSRSLCGGNNPVWFTFSRVYHIPDYMTKNYPLRSVKCLTPDNPFCLPRVPTDEWMGDLWMATGTAYGPRLQHCLSCLHCCTCHSEKTRGRVSGQRESHQSLWPFNLLVASPTGLCVVRTCPHSVIWDSINLIGIDKGHVCYIQFDWCNPGGKSISIV